MVRTLILTALVLYLMRLVWGRGALFINAWRGARRDFYRATDQHRLCEQNHEHRHVFEDTCTHADTVIEVWPAVSAFGVLMDNTYLCIEVPCWSLVSDAASSWPGFMLVSILPVVLLCTGVGYVRLANRVSQQPDIIYQPAQSQQFASRLPWGGGVKTERAMV